MTTFSEPEIISLIDLTRLKENDDVIAITEFCKSAHTPLGDVAAVCVYPEFIITAKEVLAETQIPIATVANFPYSEDPLDEVLDSIHESIEHGAQEIDVVLPYQQLIHGEQNNVIQFLKSCREATADVLLKVIIESGALNAKFITLATSLVVACGADFVKTSTGKHKHGASLHDIDIILNTLSKTDNPPGIKISGGVRTPEQAREYLDLISQYMGDEWIRPEHVRIGASQLLQQLIA